MRFTDILTDIRKKVVLNSDSPRRFLTQQIQPLLMDSSANPGRQRGDVTFTSEREFWQHNFEKPLSIIRLNGFVVSDWFPRSPGLFWSRGAIETRLYSDYQPFEKDPDLGFICPPTQKMEFVELGGVGSIRLRPRHIDRDYCWLATAVKTESCHAGIPLAIPEVLLKAGFRWGQQATLIGRVRYLQDAGLGELAKHMRGSRQLIVFVERLTPAKTATIYPVDLVPVTLFEMKDKRSCGYTFVHCNSTRPNSLETAATWMEKYASKYGGRVLTNFDQQVPTLAGAPLSYQRLVDKTYGRKIAGRYVGQEMIERLDTLIQYDNSTHYHSEVRMGHNISVGGDAIISIDSVLENSTQTINKSKGLTSKQKKSLDYIVQKLHSELKPIENSHPDEVKEIANAAQKVIVAATKPEAERRKPFLDLSAEGLLRTVKLISDVAPTAIHAAEKLATFVQGLV